MLFLHLIKAEWLCHYNSLVLSKGCNGMADSAFLSFVSCLFVFCLLSFRLLSPAFSSFASCLFIIFSPFFLLLYK